MMNRRQFGGLALAGLGAVACDASTPPRATLVFAAASLTAPFQAMARAFEAAHAGQRIDLHFAGTPQLVLQVREGAAADVFAAADTTNMAKLVAAGHTAAAPREFARNHLAIAVAKGNPRRVFGLVDLARADLKVALCGPDVPVGRYARQALAKAGATVASASDEASVKALVAKIGLGELDAGIVYATDGNAEVDTIAVTPAHDVIASYPVAVLNTGHHRAGGEAFAAFVLGSQGRRILAEHGFTLP